MITGIDQQLCLKCLGVSAVMDLVEDPQCVLGIVQLEPTSFGSATAYALGSASYALLVRLAQGHLDPDLGSSV